MSASHVILPKMAIPIRSRLTLLERAAAARLGADVFIAKFRAPDFVRVGFAAEVSAGVAAAGMLGEGVEGGTDHRAGDVRFVRDSGHRAKARNRPLAVVPYSPP